MSILLLQDVSRPTVTGTRVRPTWSRSVGSLPGAATGGKRHDASGVSGWWLAINGIGARLTYDPHHVRARRARRAEAEPVLMADPVRARTQGHRAGIPACPVRRCRDDPSAVRS